MQVFISWHGGVSKQVAEELREWLPSVIQVLEPFVSSEDIHKGDVWFGEVSGKLGTSGVGILCLTPEALTAPWILFEAGALSKQVGQKRVIPLLIGTTPADLKPPLSNFQATLPTRDDLLRLMQTINASLGEHSLPEDRLKKAFETWWPELEAVFAQAKEALAKGGPKAPARALDDMVLEMLELVRGLAQRGLTITAATPDDALRWLSRLAENPSDTSHSGFISRARRAAMQGVILPRTVNYIGHEVPPMPQSAAPPSPKKSSDDAGPKS